MVAIIIPAVWGSAGPGSIFYLAGLKSIPEQTYEAADLDGAGPFGKIRYVTLPSLMPLMLINLVGTTVGAFRASQQIFVMTAGGAGTKTLGLDIWYNAFLYLKFGYATAEAWIMGVMLIGFTVWQLNILKRVEFRARKVDT